MTTALAQLMDEWLFKKELLEFDFIQKEPETVGVGNVERYEIKMDYDKVKDNVRKIKIAHKVQYINQLLRNKKKESDQLVSHLILENNRLSEPVQVLNHFQKIKAERELEKENQITPEVEKIDWNLVKKRRYSLNEITF
jgi:cell division protein FtsI/penicillin-binding protein 2